jgi:hypothetical protein
MTGVRRLKKTCTWAPRVSDMKEKEKEEGKGYRRHFAVFPDRDLSCTSSSESESESLCVLFLLPELSAMVQKPSLAKQLSPLKFLDDCLLLRRTPSSSLLLELKVEYAELESTSLAPPIARVLPRLSFFLDHRSSLCLFLCLLLWSRLYPRQTRESRPAPPGLCLGVRDTTKPRPCPYKTRRPSRVP